jgi:hypothetical protein
MHKEDLAAVSDAFDRLCEEKGALQDEKEVLLVEREELVLQNLQVLILLLY